MTFLVLFDIDKTLLTSAKHPATHRKAFSFAIKKVYGINTKIDFIVHAGMTDQQIVRGLLVKAGVNDEKITAGLGKCMELMNKYFLENLGECELEPLPGVKELLKKLEVKGFLLGLVTGNLEPIAWRKLENAGLKAYFRLGGFGSDNPDRSKLVKIAMNRAEEQGFTLNKVFLLGDTIKDVKAGKANRVTVLAVATGDSTVEELKAEGADFVLENLEDTDGIVQLLGKPD